MDLIFGNMRLLLNRGVAGRVEFVVGKQAVSSPKYISSQQ
jgi:hypothetical protein